MKHQLIALLVELLPEDVTIVGLELSFRTQAPLGLHHAVSVMKNHHARGSFGAAEGSISAEDNFDRYVDAGRYAYRQRAGTITVSLKE